jgi:ribosomal protein L40E
MADADEVRTMMGVSPEAAAEFMAAGGADVLALVGLTCHAREPMPAAACRGCGLAGCAFRRGPRRTAA